MAPKNVVSFRIDPDTLTWLKALAESRYVGHSEFLGWLVEALRQGQVVILSEPVPLNDGSDPGRPVFVCLNPQ